MAEVWVTPSDELKLQTAVVVASMFAEWPRLLTCSRQVVFSTSSGFDLFILMFGLPPWLSRTGSLETEAVVFPHFAVHASNGLCWAHAWQTADMVRGCNSP